MVDIFVAVKLLLIKRIVMHDEFISYYNQEELTD